MKNTQTGKNKLLRSAVPSAWPWEGKSSLSARLRRPRTSPRLHRNPFPLHHETFSIFKTDVCWNKRELFVLLQKTSPPAPRTKRTRPGSLFPPHTFHITAERPHSSIPKYIRIYLGQTWILSSNTEHFILSIAGPEAADGRLKYMAVTENHPRLYWVCMVRF